MNEHIHEPTITLDGRLICRICGESLKQATEEIASVGSKKTANRILGELAVAGNYYASPYENGFIVFSKTREDGIVEELVGEKFGTRDFRIIKRFLAREVTD